jgi:hypothetical protein
LMTIEAESVLFLLDAFVMTSNLQKQNTFLLLIITSIHKSIE